MELNIKDQIKKRGYWRVIICPSKKFLNKVNIDKGKLSDIIADSQVRLRGWYYPHISNKYGIKFSGMNEIKNECDFFSHGHGEIWKFTTTGIFKHILSMKEDYVIDNQLAEEIKSRFVFNEDKAHSIKIFFAILYNVYKFTEIFLFASNLAQLKEYDDVEEFEIKIDLIGVKDRMLFLWDRGRDLYKPYICEIENNEINLNNKYKKEELIANFSSYALERATETILRFNWENPNYQVFSQEQKKFLERRL